MFSIPRYIMSSAVVMMMLHLIGGGVHEVDAAVSYTPASKIYMTGSSLSGAYASVYSVIYDNAALASPPYFDVGLKQFSGSLYLSGAGWIDIGGVGLNCGSQLLSNLTSPCSLFGTGAGEIVGDIVFQPGKVQFLPSTLMLSGAVMTNIGEIGVSGIILPLGPVSVSGLTSTGVVDYQKQFTLQDAYKYRSNPGGFTVRATPLGTPDISVGGVAGDQITLDVSLASRYIMQITDPSGSVTEWSYETFPDVPSQTLQSAFAEVFCMSHGVTELGSRCPDGSTMSSTQFSVSPSSVVADGASRYIFTLKLRDRYGNRVTEGYIAGNYTDNSRMQQLDIWDINSTYISCISGCSSLTGSLTFGSYSQPVSSHDVTYSIGSFAPTDSIAYTLQLQELNYKKGVSDSWQDFSQPGDKNPVIFDPIYTVTVVPDGDLVVGGEAKFIVSGQSHPSVVTLPSDLKEIFGLSVGGDNLLASYSGLNTGNPSEQVCTQNHQGSGPPPCDWSSISTLGHTPPVISLLPSAPAFTGVYTPHVADPTLEEVWYRSFVTYSLGDNAIIYPSGSGLLGTSVYDNSLVKILGQNNVGQQYNGIEEKRITENWTQIRAEVAGLSRNLTGATLVGDGYQVFSGSQSINASSFSSARSVIIIGGDATITGDLGYVDRPRALIVLEKDGIGGNISIDPNVKDVSASLFAERAITSSGDNQLVIQGTIMSYNTMNDAAAGICPRFVETCDSVQAKKYDLAEMRRDFKTLPPPSTSHASTLDIAGSYPTTPLIIQYDGRVLTDPPPGFSQ